MSAVLRKRLSKGWTGIPNTTIRDQAISFRATGLLAFLLSMDDGWSMNGTVIAERKGQEGRDAVRTAARELRAAGYLRHTKARGEGGRIVTEVEVSDVPIAEWKGSTEPGDDLGDGPGDEAATGDGIPGPGDQAPGEPSSGGPGHQGKTLVKTPDSSPLPPASGGISDESEHQGQHQNCRACGTNRRGAKPEAPTETPEQRAARIERERNAEAAVQRQREIDALPPKGSPEHQAQLERIRAMRRGDSAAPAGDGDATMDDGGEAVVA